MKTAFRGSFAKDIRKLRDESLKRKLRHLIETVERASRLDGIPNLKRLTGKASCCRIRLGDYRVGLAIEADTVVFVRFLHRREIYRYFP
ncbi:MAG: type II toxin-antitoxin system RelE/ParE family toxin [bacterium]